MTSKPATPRGFTLIELMIVIAIIGLLSSMILASLSSAKVKANNAKRIEVAKQVENALEVYYINNNRTYPSTMPGPALQTSCALIPNNVSPVIPGLSPTYLNALQPDPNTDGNSQCCYMYKSNGVDYKFWFGYLCPTGVVPTAVYSSYPRYIDPVRPGTTWAVFTPGAAAW